MSAGHEGGAGVLREQGQALQEGRVAECRLEGVMAAKHGPRFAARRAYRLLHEQLVQPAGAQIVGRRQVGDQFGARQVEQVNSQRLVGRQPADQEEESAPGGFDLLEGGMVQQGAHSAADGFVHGRFELSLARVWCGDEVRPDHAAEEGVKVAGDWRFLPRRPRQSEHLFEQHGGVGLRRHGRNRRGRRRLDLCPAAHLLRRGRESAGIAQAAAQVAQRLKHCQSIEEPVGLKVVQFADADQDAAGSVGGQRYLHLNAQPGHYVLEIVAVDPQQVAVGEGGGALPTTAAAAEIAQDRMRNGVSSTCMRECGVSSLPR